MTPRTFTKMWIDFLMMILLICLMAYQITGQLLHEWIGIGIFVLFIAHHMLNLQWYQRLTKGRYTAVRAANTAIGLLILIAMLGLMVSSVFLSQYVFAFLPIHGGMAFARTAHLLCSYWGLVLMSLHIGLHCGMMSGMTKKSLHIKKTPMALRIGSKIAVLIIAAYGLYAFVTEHISDYLFLRTHFVFFDYEASAISVFAKYVAMMIMFAALACYGAKLLRRAENSKQGRTHGRV